MARKRKTAADDAVGVNKRPATETAVEAAEAEAAPADSQEKSAGEASDVTNNDTPPKASATQATSIIEGSPEVEGATTKDSSPAKTTTNEEPKETPPVAVIPHPKKPIPKPTPTKPKDPPKLLFTLAEKKAARLVIAKKKADEAAKESAAVKAKKAAEKESKAAARTEKTKAAAAAREVIRAAAAAKKALTATTDSSTKTKTKTPTKRKTPAKSKDGEDKVKPKKAEASKPRPKATPKSKEKTATAAVKTTTPKIKATPKPKEKAATTTTTAGAETATPTVKATPKSKAKTTTAAAKKAAATKPTTTTATDPATTTTTITTTKPAATITATAPVIPLPVKPPVTVDLSTCPFKTAESVLSKVAFALYSVQPDLDMTRQLLEDHHHAYPYHRSALDNPLPMMVDPTTMGTINIGAPTNPSNATTGGFCNTNHEVILTGDPTVDRLNELKRNYEQRQRQRVPETKGTERWDKPRIMGQRRRRIVREVDSNPNAPKDAPPSGYIVFVGQLTCKRRHDNPNKQHHQPTVMQDIARVWKEDMADCDREYYMEFAKEAQVEYGQQQMEYRATGFCTASRTFIRLGGDGPWVRKDPEEQNDLEQEISTYESVHFPLRPPSQNEDYMRREWCSKVSRKLKDKGITRQMGRNATQREQDVITEAVDNAKAEMLDSTEETFETVDQVALVNAATAAAMTKLQDFSEAQKIIDEFDVHVEPDPLILTAAVADDGETKEPASLFV